MTSFQCFMTHPLAALRTQPLPLGLLRPLPGEPLLLLPALPLLAGLHPLRGSVRLVDEDALVTLVTDVVTLVLVKRSGSQVIPKQCDSEFHPLRFSSINLPTSLHLTFDAGCVECFSISSNDLLYRIHRPKQKQTIDPRFMFHHFVMIVTCHTQDTLELLPKTAFLIFWKFVY